MTKAELASYLVDLHTLIGAQTTGQRAVASSTLAEEYDKCWGLLKDTIKQENENETRSSERQRPSGPEDRTDLESSKPLRRRQLGEGE